MTLRLREYIRADGSNPYREWFDGLDAQAAAKVTTNLVRLEMGNTSNLKWFSGIGELRVNWGPGYRVYLAQDGRDLILLLGGGTKKRQQADIKHALAMSAEVQGMEGNAEKRIRQKGEGEAVALTRDYKKTIVQRIRRDPSFTKALLNEAATLFLNGEASVARVLLRDLVNSTVGFERLAAITDRPSKSLHRMLSPDGNPSMDNLAAIFRAMLRELNVEIKAQTVRAA